MRRWHRGELNEQSLSIVTSLVPLIGYEKAAAIEKESVGIGRTVREICAERLEELGITADQLAAALDLAAMAGKAVEKGHPGRDESL